MKNKSLTNVSFDFLQESQDFLNLVIHNLSSCVMLLDNQMMLYAYNEPLTTIFSNKEGENILYVKCGNAIGCAHTIDEAKECGTSSKCKFCELRETALLSYSENRTIFKQRIDREFYTNKKHKEPKHLQFSTRIFKFNNDKYILLIIDDITKLTRQQELIEKHEQLIRQLTSTNTN
jgi:nitrogen fixation/metabolism regulation signal transduction histidine kinase